MSKYLLARLGDQALERDMLALFAEDCPRIALEIAHVAEFDDRRLYAPQGFPSMFEYLVNRARLSDDAALKRIRAARAARAHPELFEALAQGRLHLTAVVLLGPRLRRDNVDELVAAATHRTLPAAGRTAQHAAGGSGGRGGFKTSERGGGFKSGRGRGGFKTTCRSGGRRGGAGESGAAGRGPLRDPVHDGAGGARGDPLLRAARRAEGDGAGDERGAGGGLPE